jgi:hypothetical protein
MQDRESQSDVNPGIVEQGLDDAGARREAMQGSDAQPGGARGGEARREAMQDGGADGDGGRREGSQQGAEPEGMRGGPITERERPDGGQITQREAFDERGQVGREGMMHGSRSGGSENTTDRSDPMPPAGGSVH